MRAVHPLDPPPQALSFGQLMASEILETVEDFGRVNLALADQPLALRALGRGQLKQVRLLPKLLEAQRGKPLVNLFYIDEILHEFIMPEEFGGMQIRAMSDDR